MDSDYLLLSHFVFHVSLVKSVQGWTWPLPGTGRVAGPRNASGSLSREAVVVLMLFHTKPPDTAGFGDLVDLFGHAY